MAPYSWNLLAQVLLGYYQWYYRLQELSTYTHLIADLALQLGGAVKTPMTSLRWDLSQSGGQGSTRTVSSSGLTNSLVLLVSSRGSTSSNSLVRVSGGSQIRNKILVEMRSRRYTIEILFLLYLMKEKYFLWWKQYCQSPTSDCLICCSSSNYSFLKPK